MNTVDSETLKHYGLLSICIFFITLYKTSSKVNTKKTSPVYNIAIFVITISAKRWVL